MPDTGVPLSATPGPGCAMKEQGSTDRGALFDVSAGVLVCHWACWWTAADGVPTVYGSTPTTLPARFGASRSLTTGTVACVTITIVDGLVWLVRFSSTGSTTGAQ